MIERSDAPGMAELVACPVPCGVSRILDRVQTRALHQLLHDARTVDTGQPVCPHSAVPI